MKATSVTAPTPPAKTTTPRAHAHAPVAAFRSLLLGATPCAGKPNPAAPKAIAPKAASLPSSSAHAPPSPAVHARDEREERDGRRERDAEPSLELDPAARHAAQLAPPIAIASVEATAATAEVARRASLEELIPALVKRIAWGGDARRGSVRIELGAGELAGGTLLVHADEGRVRVELAVPPGVDAIAWRERIERRLAARGLDVASVDVR